MTVVLAGGAGTRLWPLSTPERPKWALSLGGRSLLAAAVDRAVGPVTVVVAPGRSALARAALGGRSAEVWEEPRARGTLAPVLWAGALAARRGFTHVVVVPADQYVDDDVGLRAALAAALGPEPTLLAARAERPAEGLGWIVLEPGSRNEYSFRVARFVEKPGPSEAAALLRAGARWNMGVFVLPVAWVAAVAARIGVDPAGPPEVWWGKVPATSLDYGALEQATDLRAVAWDGAWSDLGTWPAWAAASASVGDGRGDASSILAIDAVEPWVFAPGRDVVVLGGELLVVEVDGRWFVADRRHLGQLDAARAAVTTAPTPTDG